MTCNASQIDEKKAALEGIQKFRGRLPEGFDYKKELAEAREEHYLLCDDAKTMSNVCTESRQDCLGYHKRKAEVI